jgi:Domain of unknown function (DUF397)
MAPVAGRAERSTGNNDWRKSSYSANGGQGCVEVGSWRK